MLLHPDTMVTASGGASHRPSAIQRASLIPWIEERARDWRPQLPPKWSTKDNTQLSPRKVTPAFVNPVLEDEEEMDKVRASRQNSPWNHWWCSPLTLLTTVISTGLLLITLRAFTMRQGDPKGCDMYYSRPIFINFADFDAEHTRFASKYSLHLYRELGFDEDAKVREDF